MSYDSIEPFTLGRQISSFDPSKGDLKEIKLKFQKSLIWHTFFTMVIVGTIVVCSLGLRGYFTYQSNALYGAIIALCSMTLYKLYIDSKFLYDSYLQLKSLNAKRVG